MEGFKTNLKMVKNLPCYKEGGAVYKSRHSEKKEMSEDVAQDKKIVKKAFSMHDKQEHKGEHTDLSKLKKGGRAKKDCGTVRKYKTGGMVENQYAAKKTDKDMKDIANTKRQKPALLCGGGKAYAEGGSVKQAGATPKQQKYYDKNMADAKVKEDKAMYEAIGSRGDAALKGMEEGRMDAMGTAYKKGGKAKKMSTGGSTGPVSPVAQQIIEGKRPPQTTPGQMTPDERRASVAKAFGAK
jgi:hypothetical protein